MYFSKRVDWATDPDGIIDGHFNVVKELDYECELAVIIGKEARNVEEKMLPITYSAIPSSTM